MKRAEKCYALLAISISLCPQRVEENVHTQLREKFGEKIVRMQRGDESVFEETFQYAAPKFVVPYLSQSYTEQTSDKQVKNPGKHIQKLFMKEVKQQLSLLPVRGNLKLYTTTPIASLTQLCETDENTLTNNLMCLKHKTR